MSEGLHLISAAIRERSPAILLRTPRGWFIDAEGTVVDFALQYLSEYRELPSMAMVHDRTGVRLPTTTDGVQAFADLVRKRWSHGRAREQLPIFREGLKSKDMDMFWRAFDTLAPVRRTMLGDRSMHIGEALERHLERRRHHRNGLIESIPTGWPELDARLGGYETDELVTWVARPGQGKTWCLLYQAMCAHSVGHSIVFFTTEMGVGDIAGRYYAMSENRDPRAARSRELTTSEERRMQEFTRRDGLERFRIIPAGLSPTVSMVQSIIEEVRPSAVYIDGVYFLKPREANKYRSNAESMSSVVRELKGICQTYSTPIVVTTQFNRQAGKGGKQGSLENIGGTDSFSQDSDIIIQITEGASAESRKLEVQKARRGDTGSEGIDIHFRFAPTNFTAMSADEAMETTSATSGASLWTGTRGSY